MLISLAVGGGVKAEASGVQSISDIEVIGKGQEGKVTRYLLIDTDAAGIDLDGC